MKRILTIVILIAVFVFGWWLFFNTGKKSEPKNGEEPTSVHVNKHSQAFNDKVAASVNSYLALKDAFVNADSTDAKTQAGLFVEAINQIPLDQLNHDDASVKAAAQQQLSDVKANAQPIVAGENLQEMRQDFYMVSENMYPFLKTIGYEGEKLYWQNCPMAFGDGQEANWLSSTRQINNPYLGKFHPVYKSAMLHCGEVKDSIYAK